MVDNKDNYLIGDIRWKSVYPRHGFVLVIICIFSLAGYPQDNHYWSQQFGARATLMGGAMIGGVRDNSAIFYNPGAVPFIKYAGLSVNANIYKMDRIFIEDGAGEGVNLNSAKTSFFPQIISGMFTWKKLHRIRFSYCLMTRNYENLFIKSRFTSRDFKIPTPGVDEYIGVFDYTNQLNEQWLGFAASYKLTDKLGIGLSLFANYRSQSYQQTNFTRKIMLEDSTNWIHTENNDRFVKYQVLTTLFKVGLAYETGRWNIGVTLTTPSFRIFGQGDLQREYATYEISDNPEDSANSFMMLDRVKKVKTYFHHPVVIGFGVEYAAEKTRIAVSGEYYFGIKQYRMISPQGDPFIYPPQYEDSTSVQEAAAKFLVVEKAAKPIFNVGIGLEQQLFKKISLLAGFRTDFSNYRRTDQEGIFTNNGGAWNLYHCSAGISYHRKKQIITIGLTYTFSTSVKVNPFADINPNYSDNPQATVSAQSFALSIGYTYFFPRE